MDTINKKPTCIQTNREPYQRDNDTEKTRHRYWGCKRYFLAVMVFLGSFSMFSLRTNLSISIIGMTANRTKIVDGQTVQYGPEFEWDSRAQSIVINAYAYGAVFSILGGPVTRKLGGITTYGVSLLLCGLITLIFNFVSLSEIWSRWAPKDERSKLMSVGFTGLYVGSAVSFPICGILARYWGWPSTFYFTGVIAITISFITLLSFSNDPRTDKYISKKERERLTQELQRSSQNEVPFTWKEMFTAKSFWALFVSKFAYACGYTFISIYLPLYVKDMTGMEIHRIGILSGVPNMASVFTVPITGWSADYFLNKKILSPTQLHKVYMLMGFACGAVSLFAISFVTNFTIIVIFLVLFKISISVNYLIMLLLPLYMASNNSSQISALIYYGFNMGMIITPTLMGYVVTSHDPYQWNLCLISIGVTMIMAAVIFILFGSSEPLKSHRKEREYEDEQHIKALL